MPTSLTLSELQVILDDVQAEAAARWPTLAGIIEAVKNSGLRINEVLELERWQEVDEFIWLVQLEKGEGLRNILPSTLGPAFVEALSNGSWGAWVSYYAVNKLIRRAMPIIKFNGDTRPTTFHAWRYAYMKNLKENGGLSNAEIQAIMGHLSLSSTILYLSDSIWLYP